MTTFLLVIAYFTRIPVPMVEYSDERYKKGLKLLPVVGLLMGLILYAASFVSLVFHPPVTALILLLAYIMLTGGLHLDGLADTCDGIFSGREKDRMLEIMKDSRIGSFGVLSMIFFAAFYLVMYQYIPYNALIVLPVVGKSAPLISCYLSDYARPSGMGQVICDNTRGLELFMAVVTPVAAAALLSPLYVAAAVCGLLSVVLVTMRMKKVLGGITGDTMGMACEVSQMVYVFAVYVVVEISGWPYFAAVP